MTAAELTRAQVEARANAVRSLYFAVRNLTEILDTLHGAGFSIPAPVTSACGALGAFGEALAANAQGKPAPPAARELLGLGAPVTCRDCGGFGTHAAWCPE